MTTLETQLQTFREHYPSVKCSVLDDGIVYRTRDGYAVYASDNANMLIKQLGLDLVAIPTFFSAKDSFFVKSNHSND